MQKHIETVLYHEYFKECKEYGNRIYALYVYIIVSICVYITQINYLKKLQKLSYFLTALISYFT